MSRRSSLRRTGCPTPNCMTRLPFQSMNSISPSAGGDSSPKCNPAALYNFPGSADARFDKACATDARQKGRRSMANGLDRRDLFLSAGAAALLGGFGVSPALAAEMTATTRSEKPLKAAFSNAGLQATWCAQGKRAAEYWGKLFNVEVTWFDGELSAPKQRAAIDDMAQQKWDFVAIQAFGIGTLTAPVNKMIDAGIPVIDMDTLIAPLDSINVHSFLAPDNEFMGASVTQALVNAIGGKGTITMTQGALGHTGAQGRARGFEAVVKQFPNVEVLNTDPADW